MDNDSKVMPLFPSHRSPGWDVLWVAAIALIYFLVARFSLQLVYKPEGMAAFWPTSGIFLSAILLTRRDLRPWLVGVLFAIDFIAEMLAGTPLLVSFLYSLSLTADAVLSAWLLLRFVGGRISFSRVRELAGWLLLSVIFSNALTSLVAAGAASRFLGASFWPSWMEWAAPDGVGNLLVTPLVLSWATWGRTRLGGLRLQRLLEGTALLVLMALVNYLAFSHLSEYGLFSLFLTYLIFPFLLWAALRFGMRGVASASAILAAIGIHFAFNGHFVAFLLGNSPLNTVIEVQLYLAILAVPALFLATVMAERKQSEDARHALSERQEAILAAVPDILMEVDNDKVYTWANLAGLSFFGEDVLGREAAFYFEGEQDTYGMVKPLFNGSEDVIYVESWQRRKDGEKRLLAWRCRVLKDQDGNVNGALSSAHDITERMQAEQALVAERNILHTLIDNLPDNVFIKDTDSRIIIDNVSHRRLLGATNLEQVVGKTDFDFLPKELADSYFADEKQIIQSGESLINREEPVVDKERNQRWLLTTKVPLRDSHGMVTGIVGINHDITERKRAEEEIRKLNAELEQRVEERTHELRDAQEKLIRQEKLATLGQLAGGVGHELRNPLSVINTSIYYLKLVQPEADAKIKEHHAMIEQEVHNADKIITDLLDFARVVSVEREPVSVSELVRKTLERFPVPEKVELRLEIPPDLPMVFADPQQVEQVLGNLTTNACQAMPRGGQLSVISDQFAVNGEQWVLIRVKDTGTGIMPENMHKLFEPLFTTRARGIGLGLAVSKKLAEANGGRIEVESEPGKGSTFTLYLPVVGS